MLDTCAIVLILWYLRRRRRIRRFERCERCNPRANKNKENSSDESDESSYEGECSCSDNVTSRSEYTSSEESQHHETPQPVKALPPPAPPAERREPLRRVEQNVIQRREASEQGTMRRYPPVTANIPFSFQVRHPAATGQSMCPPVRPSESFTQHMAEIEYWVKTHRAPCTYGMPLPASRPDDNTNRTVSTVDSKTDTLTIKKPVEPDISPIRNKEPTRNKLLKTISDDAKPKENVFFASTPETPQRIVSTTNGARSSINDRKNLNTKHLNGNNSNERKKRPTSTPITSRSKTVSTGKKSNSVANKSPRSRTKSTKKAATNNADVNKSKCLAGPSRTANDTSSRDVKPCIVDDSDTSVLTAPYIRSTRNSASKSKCQSLTRQRASQKNEKLLATRSHTRSQNDKNNLNVSLDTKDSNAINDSKVTSESSLDIFGGDLAKEINNSRKSTLRSSSGKKPQTLHFSGLSKVSGVKRRSEPVMTRTSVKRALLSASGGSSAEQQHNGTDKTGAFSLGATDRSCAGEPLATDDDAPVRKKFFK